MCAITIIISAICFFIGNIKSEKLMPYLLISLLINQILDYKENKTPNQYTKYDGIKIILSCILFFWIVIMVMIIFQS